MDGEIWKAARIDDIPIRMTCLFIVIPMMRPVFITTLVIIASGIVLRATALGDDRDLVKGDAGDPPRQRLFAPVEITFEPWVKARCPVGRPASAYRHPLRIAAGYRCAPFDEPLSNLDAKLRADLRVKVRRRHHRPKNKMICVTRDPVEAMTLADRIAIMKDGAV